MDVAEVVMTFSEKKIPNTQKNKNSKKKKKKPPPQKKHKQTEVYSQNGTGKWTDEGTHSSPFVI